MTKFFKVGMKRFASQRRYYLPKGRSNSKLSREVTVSVTKVKRTNKLVYGLYMIALVVGRFEYTM